MIPIAIRFDGLKELEEISVFFGYHPDTFKYQGTGLDKTNIFIAIDYRVPDKKPLIKYRSCLDQLSSKTVIMHFETFKNLFFDVSIGVTPFNREFIKENYHDKL